MSNAVAFPREWFNSVTNFVKANYLIGNNPTIKISEVLVDGKYQFTDKQSNFSKLIVDNYNTSAFREWMSSLTGYVDLSKMRILTGSWPQLWGSYGLNNNVKGLLNLDIDGGIEGCINGNANLEIVTIKNVKYAVSNALKGPKIKTIKIGSTSYIQYGILSPVCPELTTFEIGSIYPNNYSMANCPKWEYGSIMKFINNLPTITTTYTLTLGSTNLAKLTDEDKKIATDKGWTLA